MRQIAVICGVFVVLFLGLLGLLAIFGVISPEFASSTLIKVVAAVALLGVCSAAITLLLRARK
ncbi:MAG: hypothetical protein AAFX56_17135 [Pseudomonadota bacterium]